MSKRKAILTAAAVFCTAICAPFLQAPHGSADAAEQLRIMPIGDSITFGLGEDGGYRKYLDQTLKDKGISFDMVGPEGQNAASFRGNGQTIQYDDNHAGYSGYTIKQQYPVPSWGENGLYEKLKAKDAVKTSQPDIVLLIIGTNDMTANRNLNDCETDLHTLLDYIIGDMPQGSVIFLGSIPEFTAYGGNAQRVGNYNNTVKKVAESYGDQVRFADVHGCLNGMADMSSDNLHPSGAGYQKMGQFWADVIEEYLEEQNGAQDDPNDPTLLYSDFENGLSGWKSRGGAAVTASKTEAAGGSGSAAVTNRTADWNGISYALSSRKIPAGTHLSVQAQVMQKSGAAVHFKMTMQYDTDDGTVYDTFAEGDAASGEWITLSAANYVVKQGANPVLYFETSTDACDFYLDEVTIAKTDGAPIPSDEFEMGDVDHSGDSDAADAAALLAFLLTKDITIYADTADMDGNGQVDARDLSLLKQKLLMPDEPDIPNKAYMSEIRDQITANVPSAAMGKAEGKLEHITYFSKKANHDKNANVWLPPGYDSGRQYPVFYVNHGYGGDEFSMTNGMGVLEIATTLIKSGEAEPMIIVFTHQYTNPDRMTETGNGAADVPYYDAFAEDLSGSLMPYIESHYPVKTGRENTAVAGFSMGGRESLYIGMMCRDKIGYIGAGAPAPGIFPTKDQFMDHPGCMSKDDIRIDAPYEPYLLLIAGGTNDGMVGTYPQQYHELFTAHGTENIYLSVPGGNHDGSTVTPMMYNFIRFIFKA